MVRLLKPKVEHHVYDPCCGSTNPPFSINWGTTDRDREGRAQNYLMPEHIEKIVTTFEAFADVPGFTAVVDVATLRENDFNLNIRRYADNAPPPEPHDVRAHLVGGIPRTEVAAKEPMFVAHGLDFGYLLQPRDRRSHPGPTSRR
ncbi:MAG: SAM-dependent DNA methyltransferase [Steroidobacteraceae bacterium]|nr:SAM-dependent DNA methyltransferase [Steroidobacteraceae bacterium]